MVNSVRPKGAVQLASAAEDAHYICHADPSASDSSVHSCARVVPKTGSRSDDDKVTVPNPHPIKPIPPSVLQEEDYVEALSHIIERNYFPDLPHLRLRREQLEALSEGNIERAGSIEWKLAHLQRPTPCATPCSQGINSEPQKITGAPSPVDPSGIFGANQLNVWEQDDDVESAPEALSTINSDGPVRLKLTDGRHVVIDLSRMRLNDFQRIFTSEDNASFTKILARDKERLAAREWWIEDTERRHNTDYKNYIKALEDGGVIGHGTMLGTKFKGRHSFSFTPEDLPYPQAEKPRVEFKNTRFTTDQQGQLENQISSAVAACHGMVLGKSGKFCFPSLPGPTRALGGRLTSPNLPNKEVNGYALLKTPVLLPGVDGLSPLMTHGKIGSTPRLIDDNLDGPIFHIAEESERERAAMKMQRGATQRQRESRRVTKAERLRALGLTPSAGSARSSRQSPGSAPWLTPSSTAKVAPLTPIGQLIHRAQQIAQKGGRFHIGRSQSNSCPPTPRAAEGPPRMSEAPPCKRARKAYVLE